MLPLDRRNDSSPSSSSSRRASLQPPPRPLSSESLKSRLLLTVACFWPLMLLALLASSSNNNNRTNANNNNSAAIGGTRNHDFAATSITASHNLRLSLRNALDRVDIMGYGPTHPRVAVVIVADCSSSKGNDLYRASVLTSVKSVISHTDLSRIFVIAVVVDGQASDPQLEADLRAMEEGSIPHWHGTRADVHDSSSQTAGQGQAQAQQQSSHQEEEHGRKIHVIYNAESIGVAASREDAVDFVHLLASYHEQAGLKSTAEDLLLLLLEPGAQLVSHKWLAPVTQALIVPPPLLPRSLEYSSDNNNNDNAVALKLANAVVFGAGTTQGQRTSLDLNLAPVDSHATLDELNGSSGDSWMAPAWDGVALALRLETYRNLPLPQAVSFLGDDTWSANLDVAMALWLCADGMDVLAECQVQRSPHVVTPAGLSPASAARFAAAWMDDVTTGGSNSASGGSGSNRQVSFFDAYRRIHTEVTALDWDLWHAHSDAVWRNSRPSCRSFAWYMDEINPEFGAALRKEQQQQQYMIPEAVGEDENDKGAAQEPPAAEEEVKIDLDQQPKPKQQQQQQQQPQQHQPKPEQNKVDENSVAIPERREGRKPAIPLREENLKIVQQAKRIDLAFVDVANGHQDHPHLGARDVNGTLGYVHDATHLHNNPPPFGMPQQDLAKACAKHDNHYRMLTERVYVDMAGHEAAEKSGKPRAKIFCLVYTTEKGHDRIPRIRETWGSKCDGFMVGSTKTDPSIDAVNIPHDGKEEYNNIWQKVRSMWSYIYDNYYQDGYDWFHIGGDDLYLIVENLRLYLESEEIQTAANGGVYLPDGSETTQTPLFLGRRFAYQGDMNDIFVSGGSGYTMNRAALKALVTEGFPKMFAHAHTFSEDTMIARLFRQKFNVFPYDTKDDAGGERYMPFMPGHHWGYRLPDDPEKDWYARYSINIKEGPEHCSPKSVAFHYVKDDSMYRLHALLYHLCPTGSV